MESAGAYSYLQFLVTKGEEQEEVEFYFVPREVILDFKGDTGSVLLFPDARDQKKLVKHKISLRGAVRGDYVEMYGVASHRWEIPLLRLFRTATDRNSESVTENEAIKIAV